MVIEAATHRTLEVAWARAYGTAGITSLMATRVICDTLAYQVRAGHLLGR